MTSLSVATAPAPELDDTALAGALYAPQFPPAELVAVEAAGLWDAVGARCPSGPLREGPSFFVQISPGSVKFKRRDLARAERAAERAAMVYRAGGDGGAPIASSGAAKRVREGAAWMVNEPIREAAAVLAGMGGDGGAGAFLEDQIPDGYSDPLRPGKGRSRIVEWSRKSRAKMTETLLSLDYAPLLAIGTPLMVTLTLPGDWLTVAPTGAHFKAHVEAFKVRWFRRWGAPIVGVWKLEFQERGAPHLHILTARPASSPDFLAWLSATWADVVAHPDPVQRMRHERAGTGVDRNEGLRASDPRRIAVYFTKHGLLANKEYQHIVPAAWQWPGAGPGRFWGVWGLAKCVVDVPVTWQQAVDLARVARRHSAAQDPTRVASVWRANRTTGKVRRRKVRRRVVRMRSTWGFLAVNDGPGFASMLARAVPAVPLGRPVPAWCQVLA